MYCIKTDEGYFWDWLYNEKYDDDKEPEYNLIPNVFLNYEEVKDIAESINKKTDKKVEVIKLNEEVVKTFEATILTLKDLKPGDVFQFITNDSDNFVVIDTDFYIGLTESGHKGKKYHIYNSIWTHTEVKKVKI